MKKIRVHLTNIKNHIYAKIPDLIVKNHQLKDGDDIEITIVDRQINQQEEFWGVHPEDLKEVVFNISEDIHTMNMYNRIYVPEKYRFFFPINDNSFILVTNVGNIQSHLNSNGYFTQGLRQWFSVNGPLMPDDQLRIKILDEEKSMYELSFNKRTSHRLNDIID
jgi:hypothetical protein